jgi:hypothetical protein
MFSDSFFKKWFVVVAIGGLAGVGFTVWVVLKGLQILEAAVK